MGLVGGRVISGAVSMSVGLACRSYELVKDVVNSHTVSPTRAFAEHLRVPCCFWMPARSRLPSARYACAGLCACHNPKDLIEMDTEHTVVNEYELLDSGDGRKLERFGDAVLSRPCGQAVWDKREPEKWARASASFDRESGWQMNEQARLPASWAVTINDIAMLLKPTPAGHLGVFPETRMLWDWITGALKSPTAVTVNVLNLFAHSGGATLAAARAGCSVCHVDSSKSMVARARENAGLNQLGEAPIRWIVEDVGRFLDREIRRERTYDAIMLDPPSFGHGTKGEQYRIERDLDSTLRRCKTLLSSEPAFVLLTSHTQGVTTAKLESVLMDVLDGGHAVSGEMQLTGASGVRPVSSGVWVRWTPSRDRRRQD